MAFIGHLGSELRLLNHEASADGFDLGQGPPLLAEQDLQTVAPGAGWEDPFA